MFHGSQTWRENEAYGVSEPPLCTLRNRLELFLWRFNARRLNLGRVENKTQCCIQVYLNLKSKRKKKNDKDVFLSCQVLSSRRGQGASRSVESLEAPSTEFLGLNSSPFAKLLKRHGPCPAGAARWLSVDL